MMIRFQSSLRCHRYYSTTITTTTTLLLLLLPPLPPPPPPPPSSSPLPKTGWKQIYFVRALDLSLVRTHSLTHSKKAPSLLTLSKTSAPAPRANERTNERAQASAAVACRICVPLPPLLYVGACGFGVSVFPFQSRFRGSVLATLPLRLRPAIVALLPEIAIEKRSDCRRFRVSCRLASGRAISTAQVKPAHFKETVLTES